MAEQPMGPEPTGLSQEQKIGFILLLIFAIIGIALGIIQFRNTLYGPFALSDVVPSSIKDTVTGDDTLRYRDTDNDGLNDFDEKYKYGTSPYVYDTFGYGMSDADVVAKGLALCANAGKNCVDENTNVASTTVPTPPAETNTAALDISAIVNDPKALRNLLLQNGVKPEVLNKVSDGDLMVLVNQMLASSTLATTTVH